MEIPWRCSTRSQSQFHFLHLKKAMLLQYPSLKKAVYVLKILLRNQANCSNFLTLKEVMWGVKQGKPHYKCRWQRKTWQGFLGVAQVKRMIDMPKESKRGVTVATAVTRTFDFKPLYPSRHSEMLHPNSLPEAEEGILTVQLPGHWRGQTAFFGGIFLFGTAQGFFFLKTQL